MGISGPDVGTDPGETAAAESKPRFEVERIRDHFDFVGRGRIVTNNAATTQSPRELVELLAELVPGYESVHRGRSTAARLMTDLFESAYDTIAQWINAPSRRNIAIYRNTTEAHNAVMYSMLTEFRDGDNVVTTRMEHNSNYVPLVWDDERDPRTAGATRRVSAGRLRPRNRRARPRPHGAPRRQQNQADLLHRRIEFPRHQTAARRRPGDR